MRPRTFLILLALVVLLAVVARYALRSETPARKSEIGSRFLETEDINRVSRIELDSGNLRVELARKEKGWVVENRWDYPANFERIADFLRKLDSLRVAEIIPGGTEILSDVGLSREGTNVALAVRLYAEDGRLTDEFFFGNPRASTAIPPGFHIPDSRYMKRTHAPVMLVEPFLPDIQRRPSDWIRHTILDIRPADIQRMTAHPAGAEAYAIERVGGSYTGLLGLAENPINAAGADTWFRALQGLSARDVADPSIPRSQLGCGAKGHAEALLTNGVLVRVEVGDEVEPGETRYAWFAFEYAGPESVDSSSGAVEQARAEVERLTREIGPWTFVVEESRVSKLLFLREQLISAESPAEPSPPPSESPESTDSSLGADPANPESISSDQNSEESVSPPE